jgi:hypothetical protein
LAAACSDGGAKVKRGISLSLLTQLLALVIVAVPLAWVSWEFSATLTRYFTVAQATTGYDLRVSKRLITYRLKPKTSVTFTFSRPLTLFRVLSCAAIAPGVGEAQGGWSYGYAVETLDSTGKTIAKHEVHSRTVVHDRENQEEEKIRFYRGAATAITIDDNALIASKTPVAMVRLSLLPSDPGIIGIDARVYERHSFVGSSALAAFRRRSPEEQAELSHANAFPADLLTPAEMSNIARNQWRPVGPVGIEGQDYMMLVMYEQSRPRTNQEEKGK